MTRSFTLTVRYAETDAQGVVHHSNYLTWFEEGRSDFLRQQGCNYSDMEAAGFYVIVARVEVDYRAPAYYEDRITVETTLETSRGKLLVFSYRLLNQDNLLIAEGKTKHLVLNSERRPVSLPAEYRSLLNPTG